MHGAEKERAGRSPINAVPDSCFECPVVEDDLACDGEDGPHRRQLEGVQVRVAVEEKRGGEVAA